MSRRIVLGPFNRVEGDLELNLDLAADGRSVAAARVNSPLFRGFEQTPKIAGIPIGLPSDMPKAWFVALSALSKSATPARVKENATADHLRRAPTVKKGRK